MKKLILAFLLLSASVFAEEKVIIYRSKLIDENTYGSITVVDKLLKNGWTVKGSPSISSIPGYAGQFNVIIVLEKKEIKNEPEPKVSADKN